MIKQLIYFSLNKKKYLCFAKTCFKPGDAQPLSARLLARRQTTSGSDVRRQQRPQRRRPHLRETKFRMNSFHIISSQNNLDF